MRLLHVSVAVFAVVLAISVCATAEDDQDSDSVQVYLTLNGEKLHSREKRFGWGRDKWGQRKNRNKKKNKKAGKDLTELELTFAVDGGEPETLNLGKTKVLKGKPPPFRLENGKPVPDERPESNEQISLFQDVSNGSQSVLLMSCNDDTCVPVGAIYAGTELFVMEPIDAEPYVTKGKNTVGKIEEMNDERQPGKSKSGADLGVPFTFRKRRDLSLDLKMKQSLLKRKRRQLNNANNVVELVILVDYTEYKYWLDRAEGDPVAAKAAIDLYFILLVNMMDLRFEDLYEQTGDTNIKFMINAMIYAENPGDSPWMQSNIFENGGLTLADADQALDDLTVWRWQILSDFPAHDHMLVVTKSNLATDKTGSWSGSVIGAAWTGGMCIPGYSLSIIEDPGIGLIDYAAAHEIGHSLNAGHDGAAGCNDDDFYIMAKKGGSPVEGLSSTGREGHSFHFSTCAIDAMHDYVVSLGSNNCMQTSTFNQSLYDAYKSFLAPGVFLPVDTQCELQYGDGSRRCFSLDSTICSDGAWCWNPDDAGFCYTLYVREGTRCGENMRCHKGACQNSSIVMTTCPPAPSDIVTGEGQVVVVVPDDVTAIPNQVLVTSTPYQATAQTLLANTLDSNRPDTSEKLFC